MFRSYRFQRPRFFYGWTIVAAGDGLSFCQTAFFNTTLGVFLKPLSNEFGWDRATVSGAISIGTLAGGALGYIVGPLIDRHGGRWFAVIATGLMAFLLFGLSTVQNLAMFYLFFAVGRAMTNPNAIVSTVAISNWFQKHRGRAIGIAALGNRIGVGIVPPLVALIIARSDWRLAYIVLGVIIAIVGIVPSWKYFKKRPEDMGLLPDGEEPANVVATKEETLVAVAATDTGDSSHDPTSVTTKAAFTLAQENEVSWTLQQAMATRTFWILMLSSSSIWIATGAINLHQIPHMSDRGIPNAAAAGVLSTIAFIGFFGSVSIGLLQEHIGSRLAMTGLTFCLALSMVILINVDNIPLAYLYGIAYGIAFSGLTVVSQLIFLEYFGHKFLGSILGALAPVQTGLGALSPYIAGVVFDLSGSYVIFFSALAASFAAGGLLMLLAPSPRAPTVLS